ncbi:MAG: hypothetical protein GTN40_02840 [Candidatus Aenigmarchaeota archaeon]|nr:hypothetical protein [Candidatus Aenigmarchaeota archaeon]
MVVAQVHKGSKEFITKLWKDPKKGEYIAITQEVMEVRGEKIKFDFHFLGESGKEEHLELLGEYPNLGSPMSYGLCSSNPIVYSGKNAKKDVLRTFSKAGLSSEEIKELKSKL